MKKRTIWVMALFVACKTNNIIDSQTNPSNVQVSINKADTSTSIKEVIQAGLNPAIDSVTQEIFESIDTTINGVKLSINKQERGIIEVKFRLKDASNYRSFQFKYFDY